ncbi:MAG TPA: TIGR00454 family protein [Methanothermobacter sp.]|nr:TIGR00454 family protein [Methanobacteriales archaeon]MDI6882271.1 TIGR00454 family protein [Methanothermobacter sp.]MDX9693722.1 TIGR00454 family protein [Methanothermobacter sp.]HHW17099.1 TIGR00454 family protein [Methanothermobacter sp.]HOQ20521.1 TIGR00454 family protein [Methanothermobacter sp.]
MDRIIAIVMAGGKGTRLNQEHEKPLTPAGGKPLIEHVLENLEGSDNIQNIMVATSPNTPLTEDHVKSLGYSIIRTSGKGYIEDLREILSYFEEKGDYILFVINADLPLVDPPLIDEIIEYYRVSSVEALTVFVPLGVYEEHGLIPSASWRGMVPSGVNILRSKNKIQKQEVLKVPRLELALNINTPRDLIFLERLLGDDIGREKSNKRRREILERH